MAAGLIHRRMPAYAGDTASIEEDTMNVNMNIGASLMQYSDDAVGVAVLKKALDIEAQGAMQLIAALPQPPQQSAANLPPHLGQNIDTTA
jgi:hypothetical protein